MDLGELLRDALRTGDDAALRRVLLVGSGLPGPRLNLRLVDALGAAVAARLDEPELDVGALERLLDGWAELPPESAPGDQPAVVLPCVAVSAYGYAAVARPDWWPDELAKLRRAAADGRWRVRELVATALQLVLDADWDRTVAELAAWAADPDPLVVRAAAAAVAEPSLLADPARHDAATDIQRQAVAAFTAIPPPRPGEPVRVLRQALGFTISVPAAASGDFRLLAELARSDDPDLGWIARSNLRRTRLRRWPDKLAAIAGGALPRIHPP